MVIVPSNTTTGEDLPRLVPPAPDFTIITLTSTSMDLKKRLYHYLISRFRFRKEHESVGITENGKSIYYLEHISPVPHG